MSTLLGSSPFLSAQSHFDQQVDGPGGTDGIDLTSQQYPGVSGSEDNITTVRNLVAAGGTASGANYNMEYELGMATTGPPMVWPSQFVFHSGVICASREFHPTGPVVFGAYPPIGDKLGGDSIRIFGFNFEEIGSSHPTVTLGGVQATEVAVMNNATLLVTNSEGTNEYANPEGIVELEVTTNLGRANAPDAFAYLPALVSTENPRLGEVYLLRTFSTPGSQTLLLTGRSLPGLAIPIAPMDGALELLLQPKIVGSLIPAPDGCSIFGLTIPNDPTLVGHALEFQAISLTSAAPIEASFTNTVADEIHE